jgi:hypothetical protein
VSFGGAAEGGYGWSDSSSSSSDSEAGEGAGGDRARHRHAPRAAAQAAPPRRWWQRLAGDCEGRRAAIRSNRTAQASLLGQEDRSLPRFPAPRPLLPPHAPPSPPCRLTPRPSPPYLPPPPPVSWACGPWRWWPQPCSLATECSRPPSPCCRRCRGYRWGAGGCQPQQPTRVGPPIRVPGEAATPPAPHPVPPHCQVAVPSLSQGVIMGVTIAILVVSVAVVPGGLQDSHLHGGAPTRVVLLRAGRVCAAAPGHGHGAWLTGRVCALV